MANIMDQGERLRQVHVEVQRGSDVARHLGNLHGVRQSAAEVIRGATGKYLGLSCKAAKGPCLNHSIAITLEGCTVIA
jgi:hypothetical protein